MRIARLHQSSACAGSILPVLPFAAFSLRETSAGIDVPSVQGIISWVY